MSVSLADRLLGRARVVAAACLLALPAHAAPAQWSTHPGDDARWSRPEFDDSSWRRVDILSGWREQGYQGYDGIVWFRSVATLDDRGTDVGLLLGPPAYGGYEAYVGGRLIGRSRGWSSALAYGSPEVFRVPRDVIGSDGTLTLALRVRRIGWASDADATGAPVSGVLTLGAYPALADRLSASRSDRLLNEVPHLGWRCSSDSSSCTTF